MPKLLRIPSNTSRSGIAIKWTKSKQRLTIDGWYDSMVGIEGESMLLSEFFYRLGITQVDCDHAFKELKNR